MNQIDITPVWNIDRGGSFRIAVLDTGIKSSLPDLAGKVSTSYGYSVVDDDPGPSGNTEDYNGHGTMVASIVAAKTTFPPLSGYDGSGIAGVNPYSQVVPVKVLNQYGSFVRPNGSAYNLADAIDHVANNSDTSKVRVINASIGRYAYDPAVLAAIKNANDHNILFVATTGNSDSGRTDPADYGNTDVNGNPIEHSYPGLYWRAMAVSATNSASQRASYSEAGQFNSVAAPGGDGSGAANTILGADINGTFSQGVGTSFAAPHVAGLAALLLERYPTMSWETLQYRLEDTADDMNAGTFRGRDDQLGWGRINAYNATFPQTSMSHSFPAGGWQMISLPVWPLGLSATDRSNDLATLFPGANVSVYYWYVDPNNPNAPGTYLPYSDSRVPRMGVGRGYYVKFTTGSPATQGSPPPVYTGAYPFYSDNHPLPIYLRANTPTIIGTPFTPSNPIVWNTTQVNIRMGDAKGLERILSVAEAGSTSNNFVDPTLYRWNPSTSAYDAVAENTTLNPFEGYWFKANKDCELLLQPSTTRAPSSVRGSMQWHTSSLLHQIGRTDGDGWSATVGVDPVGYLQHGPYTNQVATGNNIAVWDVMIDNNTANNAQIMQLDIWDASNNTVLASRDVMRSEFSYANAYQSFNVPFYLPSASANHVLEFRLHWRGAAYLRSRILRVVH